MSDIDQTQAEQPAITLEEQLKQLTQGLSNDSATANQQRLEQDTTNNNIRWGIIGVGDVTEVKSGPALQKAAGSSLVAVMRRTLHLAQDYAKRHDVPAYYNDANDLIQDANVDAVYIATPPSSHLELARLVCNAGKPCLIEKPLARNFEETKETVDMFRDANVPLFAAYYRRGHDRFILTKRIVDGGCLGDVTSVSYRLCRGDHVRPEKRDRLGWRVQPEISGGGIFMDLGCHALDIVDFLLGPLKEVKGDAARLLETTLPVETVVNMSFRIEGKGDNAILGTALFNFACGHYEDKLVIDGSKGRIELSIFGKEPMRVYDGDNQLIEVPVPNHPEHVHQPLVQSIVDELRNVNGVMKCPSTGESALRTAQVLDDVLETYYGGRSDAFWERPETWKK